MVSAFTMPIERSTSMRAPRSDSIPRTNAAISTVAAGVGGGDPGPQQPAQAHGVLFDPHDVPRELPPVADRAREPHEAALGRRHRHRRAELLVSLEEVDHDAESSARIDGRRLLAVGWLVLRRQMTRPP
jgi:hypothetical protein